jgi:NitT/TauT family transport system substrate-binding protein
MALPSSRAVEKRCVTSEDLFAPDPVPIVTDPSTGQRAVDIRKVCEKLGLDPEQEIREEVPMRHQHAAGWSRREFLGGLTLSGTAGLLGWHPRPAAAEPPPETTRLRIAQTPAICFAPQYVAADQLLQAEGFVNVHYVKRPPALPLIVSGEADLASTDVSFMIVGIDRGQPIVILAGLHMGCYELFGTDQIRSIHDLVGKKVTVPELHAGRHLMLSTMLAYVGIDPHRDITWITQAAPESMRLLAEGQIDAFLGFPPEPQELRARRIGHLLLSMTVDRPWSQ